jgi:uncharacterized membrane protein YhhN
MKYKYMLIFLIKSTLPMKNHKSFTIIYLIFALIESFGELLNLPNEIHLFTKPALMTTLILYFLSVTKGTNFKDKTLFIFAMIFAFLGDTFLMFQTQNPLFFMLGLGSFLLMQIGYSIYFNREIEFRKSFLLQKSYWTIPVIVYALVFYKIVSEDVGGLKVAILAYTVCIATMMLSAINRFGAVSPKSYRWVFFGALFFMISDSILAINKFVDDIPNAGFWIMSTYCLAQYLIVRGVTVTRTASP